MFSNQKVYQNGCANRGIFMYYKKKVVRGLNPAILALVGDCFFLLCANLVIFKILISIGINLVKYFILLMALPNSK